MNTQKICKELLTQKPTDLTALLLNANSFFDCGNYEECINHLEIAKNIYPRSSEDLENFALVYKKKKRIRLSKTIPLRSV